MTTRMSLVANTVRDYPRFKRRFRALFEITKEQTQRRPYKENGYFFLERVDTVLRFFKRYMTKHCFLP